MRRVRSAVVVAALAAVLVALTAPGAGAAGADGSSAPPGTTVLAQAPSDECFAGVGQPYPAPVSQAPDGSVTCPSGSQPKVNQAYVWGLTQAGGSLWFGTAANVQCLVLGTYLHITSPVQTRDYVCEGDQSQIAKAQPALGAAGLGDWRPPRLYRYDLHTRTLSPLVPPPAAQPLLGSTLGIRSAGSADGVVLFAGPALTGGINMFAFDTKGNLLGAQNIPAYTNIRKWVSAGGRLYTGVALAGGGGAVLRWTGTKQNPFSFDVVGRTDAEVAELAPYAGRLAVTTWPNLTTRSVAGLWISPVMHAGGLTTADAGSWKELWKASSYEPDPVTALTYGGGALQSFGGYLYFGTMHVPFTATLAHELAYGPDSTPAATLATVLGTQRAISIFRLRLTGDRANPQAAVRLLYGETKLPAYDPTSRTWGLVPNLMGQSPQYGHSGFGNPFNNYTWTMGVHHDRLYVGTMDWSYLLATGLPQLLQQLGLNLGSLGSNGALPATAGMSALDPNRIGFGADLWRFGSANGPASPVSTNGLGNYLNYGIRTMLPTANGLYLGMADPMNLRTTGKRHGGWELLRLR